MTRVVIIGNAGGGKSTLARELGKALGLPVHSIDNIQWQPGWVSTPAQEFNLLHQRLIEGEKWIIDGFGPLHEAGLRFDAADTIVFVDLPLWRHYWWAAKRQFMCLFRERPDGPKGCPMLPMTWKLLRMIGHIHKVIRPQLIEAVNERRAQKDIFRIRSPNEMEAFRRMVIGQSISIQAIE